MSYLALARKLRPQNFDQIVSQDFVVTTIKNAIEMDRVVHAYLFTGARGVGKTSTARIFAKALNCLNPDGINPCNECENCTEITNGTSMDISEIDGASNRGIEEIRELREAVRFIPLKCRYKVYIIDEVHMLTEPAFNALLKTLEEPPSHVIFILATTDPQNIPATILSRCQRYDFKKIPFQKMKDSLIDTLQKENISYDDDALNMVIRNSDGCMRDSLSLVDQIIAFTNGTVDKENTAFLLGFSERNLIDDLFRAVIEEDTEKVAPTVQNISNSGINFMFAAETLLHHTRNLLFMIVNKGKGDETFTADETAFYQSLMKLTDENKLFAMFQIFQKLLSDLKYFNMEQYVFEFGIYKAASFSKLISSASIGSATSTSIPPKQTVVKPSFSSSDTTMTKPVTTMQRTSEQQQNNEVPLKKPAGDDALMHEIIKILNNADMPPLASNLGHGYISSDTNEVLKIGFGAEKIFHYNYVSKRDNYEIIKKTILDNLSQFTDVVITLDDSTKKKSIVEKRQEAESYFKRKTRKEAEIDPLAENLIKEFKAEVLSISVTEGKTFDDLDASLPFEDADESEEDES